MLKGNNAVRGIGGAGGKFADVYGQYVSADNKEKLSLARMNYDLSDAKRKENLGFSKDAAAAMDSLRKHKQDANRFAVDKAKAKGVLLGKVGTINKPGKGATPNFDINAQASIAADLKSTTPIRKGETPEQYEARINAAAYRQVLEMKGTRDITSKSNVTSTSNVTSQQLQDKGPGVLTSGAEVTESKEVGEGVKHFEAILSAPYKSPEDKATIKKYMDANGGDAAKAARAYAEDTRVTSKAATSGGAPAPKPAPKSVLPPGTTTGKFVKGKGTEVLDKAGNVIGHAN
jgi:hypothetical protein